jgi:hypothetical protein
VQYNVLDVGSENDMKGHAENAEENITLIVV